jgi:hypothetical protein
MVLSGLQKSRKPLPPVLIRLTDQNLDVVCIYLVVRTVFVIHASYILLLAKI